MASRDTVNLVYRDHESKPGNIPTSRGWAARGSLQALASAEPALDAVPEGVLDIDAVRLVSVNGRLRPALSILAPCPPAFHHHLGETRCGRGDQAIAQRLGQISYAHDMPMLALNTAYLHDGVIVEVAEGDIHRHANSFDFRWCGRQ